MAEFKMNFDNRYQIDITPDTDERTWVDLAPGVMNVSPSTNDVLSEDVYMDAEGFGETDVTGLKPAFAISGHRKVGDPAQDYVVSVAYEKGARRRTSMRWTNTDGRTLEFKITIINPVISGGDASAKETFSCEFRGNGMPVVVNDETALSEEPPVAAE